MSRPTIRVELNPKTILIAIADDRKNLCKIFAAATGRCLWAADRHEPGLFQLGPRSMLRPLEQLGHRAMPRAMHLALIAREQVGGGASAKQKETPARCLPPGLVPDKLLLRLLSSRATRFQYPQLFSGLPAPKGLPNGNAVMPLPTAASRRCAASPKFRKLGNVRRDPARLVARSLRRPK
jgi:hypothetical protein